MRSLLCPRSKPLGLGLLAAAALLSGLLACGSHKGSSSSPSPQVPVTIAVSPTTAQLVTGATQSFQATVSGSTNAQATWSVTEAGGGTITPAGLYTAPGSAGTFHVTATSVADTTKQAQATVTVTSAASLPTITAFTATPASITAGQPTSLSWSVSGATSLRLDQGIGPVSASSQTVSPGVTTEYTLMASNAAGSRTASVKVTVVPPGVTGTLSDLHTAAPTVLVAVITAGPYALGDGGQAPAPDLTPTSWTVNGQPAAAIHRYSLPYDEGKKDDVAQTYPVTVQHRIYLSLAQPLQEGATYAIATPYGNSSFTFQAHDSYCESLKVNQVGYSSRATSRFANLGVFMGDGGSMSFTPLPSYEVIDEHSGQTVASGQAVDMGDDTAITGVTSGERVYRLSLNAVPSGGPYFVSLPGFGRSRSFGVGDAYSRQIAYTVTRGLYHQRCGIALEEPYTDYTRAACHQLIADARVPWVDSPPISYPAGSPLLPIIGGYHDAGDFDRRPFHTIIPLLMLSYFEAFPAHFVDGQYNLPESGNGIPDFLDEALWGLKLWENLQIMDPADPLYGGVRAGTGDVQPAYGHDSAASDSYVYTTYAVQEGDTTGSDVTPLCAGLFAQASRLVRPYDAAHADLLQQKAQLAWAFLLRRGVDVTAPRTRFMYPALQLFLATGDESYHTLFKNAAQAIVVSTGTWPEQYLPGNITATCQTAHFISYLLSQTQAVDATLAQQLKDVIFHIADTETYMGPPPEGQPYPQGVTRFLGWGSGTAQGRYADVYAFASLLTPDASKKQAYLNAVSQYADYSLGLNPLGVSFYTGLGTDQPRSSAHLDSYFTKYGASDGITSDHVDHPIGNVPGILLYGPADGRSGAAYQMVVSDQLYPAFEALPAERRWADGWSLINGCEFSTWETIVWNVAMEGFLYDASADPQ